MELEMKIQTGTACAWQRLLRRCRIRMLTDFLELHVNNAPKITAMEGDKNVEKGCQYSSWRGMVPQCHKELREDLDYDNLSAI